MAEKARHRDWGGIAYFLALIFFIPVGIGKFILGASWIALGSVYAAWILFLVLFGATSRGTRTERSGWPIVMAIFFTLPAIIVGLLLLRETAGIR